MATFLGRNGVVNIGTDPVAEIRNISVNESNEPIDNTAMGSEWKTFMDGIKAWDASVEAHQDPTNAAGQGAIVNGAVVTAHFLHQGAGTGNMDVSGSGIVTGVQTSQAHDGLVAVTFNLTGNGPLAKVAL